MVIPIIDVELSSCQRQYNCRLWFLLTLVFAVVRSFCPFDRVTMVVSGEALFVNAFVSY